MGCLYNYIYALKAYTVVLAAFVITVNELGLIEAEALNDIFDFRVPCIWLGL